MLSLRRGESESLILLDFPNRNGSNCVEAIDFELLSTEEVVEPFLLLSGLATFETCSSAIFKFVLSFCLDAIPILKYINVLYIYYYKYGI